MKKKKLEKHFSTRKSRHNKSELLRVAKKPQPRLSNFNYCRIAAARIGDRICRRGRKRKASLNGGRRRRLNHERKTRGTTNQSCNSGEGGATRCDRTDGRTDGRRDAADLEIIQPSRRRSYGTDWRAKGPLAAPRSLAHSSPSDPRRALI